MEYHGILSNIRNWDFNIRNYPMPKEEAEIVKDLLVKQSSIKENAVNHPDHYNKPGQKECIDEIEDILGTEGMVYFCLGNTCKYLYRAGNKANNSEMQDIQKALWYYNKAVANIDKTNVRIPSELSELIDEYRGAE